MSETDKNDVPDGAEQPANEAIEDAEIMEDGAPELGEWSTEPVAEAEIMDDPASDVPETLPEPVAERPKGGGLMLLLGGVAAGAIGFAAAEFTNTDDSLVQLQSQSEQILALQERLDSLPTESASVDLAPIDAQIAELSNRLDEAVQTVMSEMSAQTATVEARIVELEKQPNADGTLSETALEAYQLELDALRAELTEQQGAVMSAAAQAEADLAAARAEAEQLEQEAIAAAEGAKARAVINRIATAVETGAPFADALSDLDASIPTSLSDAAQSGVATTADLVAEFPAAARSALAVARSEGVSDEAGGIGGFLRSQLQVRSTTPKEGSDPDAVLSRAEAAVKEGLIADALVEIDALPEVVRADLTDWTARAQQRADVLDAISTLSETYQ